MKLEKLKPIRILWVVFCAWLIWSGAVRIYKAANHHGPGRVNYESDSRIESEAQFKRHNYTMGGLMCFLGGLFAGCVIYRQRWQRGRSENF